VGCGVTAHDTPGACPGVAGGGAVEDELGVGAETGGPGIAHDCCDIVKKLGKEASRASFSRRPAARALCASTM
jgi:hypothetical protein